MLINPLVPFFSLAFPNGYLLRAFPNIYLLLFPLYNLVVPCLLSTVATIASLGYFFVVHYCLERKLLFPLAKKWLYPKPHVKNCIDLALVFHWSRSNLLVKFLISTLFQIVTSIIFLVSWLTIQYFFCLCQRILI